MKFTPSYLEPWWPDLRERAFQKYGRRCLVCGHTGSRDNPLQMDHILPCAIFRRHRKKLWNLQPMCRLHNKAKSYRSWKDFRSWKGHTWAKLAVLNARVWFELRRRY